MSAYAPGSGAALAQVAAPGKGQELAAAKEVLRRVSLEGRVVVADALLTQREVGEQIVAGGGDYLFPAPVPSKRESAHFAPRLGGGIFPHWRLKKARVPGCPIGKFRSGGSGEQR